MENCWISANLYGIHSSFFLLISAGNYIQTIKTQFTSYPSQLSFLQSCFHMTVGRKWSPCSDWHLNIHSIHAIISGSWNGFCASRVRILGIFWVNRCSVCIPYITHSFDSYANITNDVIINKGDVFLHFCHWLVAKYWGWPFFIYAFNACYSTDIIKSSRVDCCMSKYGEIQLQWITRLQLHYKHIDSDNTKHINGL